MYQVTNCSSPHSPARGAAISPLPRELCCIPRSSCHHLRSSAAALRSFRPPWELALHFFQIYLLPRTCRRRPYSPLFVGCSRTLRPDAPTAVFSGARSGRFQPRRVVLTLGRPPHIRRIRVATVRDDTNHRCCGSSALPNTKKKHTSTPVLLFPDYLWSPSPSSRLGDFLRVRARCRRRNTEVRSFRPAEKQ